MCPHTTRKGPESLKKGHRRSLPTGQDDCAGGRGTHPQQLPVAADKDADVVLAVPPLGHGQVAAVPGKGNSCHEEERAWNRGARQEEGQR